MAMHNLYDKLNRAAMRDTGQAIKPVAGHLMAWGTAAPTDGVSGFAPSCEFHDTANGEIYINKGTKTSATWTKIELPGQTLNLLDSESLVFGTGNDVDVKWDGSNLLLIPVANDTGAFLIGNGTNDIDVKFFLGGTGAYAEFNVGDGRFNIEGAELHMGDNDAIEFGDGIDVAVKWNGTLLVASAALNAMWDNCPSKLDPNYLNKVFDFEDDFHILNTVATTGDWLEQVTGTGTTAIGDNAAGVGGICIFTCQPTTNDAAEGIAMVNSPFFLAAGKDLWFECRFKLEGSITAADIQIGLVSNGEDLTAVTDNLAADGVMIHMDNGAAALKITASKGGTDTGANADIGTLTLGAWTTVGFFVNGVTNITPYVDGVADTAITATLPDDTSLGIHLAVRNGDGTTQEIMHVDYAKAVQLR